MTTSLARVKICYEQDVVHARQRARLIAEQLGFDRQDQTRISTAVSEIARNAHQYGRGGEVLFMLETTAHPPRLSIAVHDHGPGIAELDTVLEGRYTSRTGLGLGIVGSRRLLDHFHIDTRPGQGTTVTLGKSLPLAAPAVTPVVLRRIADALTADRGKSPLEEIRTQNQELVVELTVRKQLEAEIRDAREYAENIVETVREPLVVLDADLKILTANQSFYDTFRVTLGETIGYFIYDLGSRQWDIPALRLLLEDILPNKTLFTGYEVEHDFPEIGRKTILLNARQIYRNNVGSHIILLAMEDMTRRKEIQAELLLKDQALMRSEKMASIGQLAAGVAHEINNPLGFIISNLRVLSDYFNQIVRFDRFRRDLDDSDTSSVNRDALATRRVELKIDYILDDGADLISGTLGGAMRVTKIVKDLKSYTRLDALEKDAIPLDRCLESALAICNTELKYVATIRKEYELLPKVLCNQGQLNQVFLNLLVNAGQAITAPGEIVLRSRSDELFVYVSVSDTGRGIPEEIRGRIFDPFFTTKEVGKGTGLGLSISAEIVKNHNGELLVESIVGVGTTFTVKLPRTKGIQ